MQRGGRPEDVALPISSEGIVRNNNPAKYDRRAASVGRAVVRGGLQIVGTSDKIPRRSKSTERQQMPTDLTASSFDSTADNSGDKKRKSKMEKIRQLQAKNELYKVEFKRVQKDRKHLKRDIEARNQEIESLTKEIDGHIAETSVLKLKLSEALQELDCHDEDSQRDLTVVKNISKDLAEAKNQLDYALSRAGTLKDDLDDMKERVKRKDEQIESLADEVSNQVQLVRLLETENANLRKAEKRGSKDEGDVEDLQQENQKLQNELGSTLERAASMVKEREDAIADLLKENEEIKRSAGVQEEKSNEATHVGLQQLKADVEAAHMDLEESQDRTAMLEEEIEGWIIRSGEMEAEIERLQDEVEAWQKKASAAQEVVGVVEAHAEEKVAEAARSKKALAEMEARHKTALSEFEAKHRSIVAETQIKHRAALVEVDSKHKAALAQATSGPVAETAEDSVHSSGASSESPSDAQSRQAMLLQAAVAARQNKSAASAADAAKGSWRNVISGFVMPPEEEEELDESQKRIKELEALNDAKEEEIKKLKSETVRLSSGYKEVMYVNKKKIERLTSENEAHAGKIAALERQLAEARGETPVVASC